jgi:hypothetical protein
MLLDVKGWLSHLQGRATGKGHSHIDLLINTTGLEYPLLQQLNQLKPPPQLALLFTGTPEHGLAEQGPVLVRLAQPETAHIEWLGQFLQSQHREARVLSPLSDWPFEALAEHLRWCTQAHWDQGNSSGIFCYYDARLFKCIVEALAPLYSTRFHAAVFNWCWLDRNGKALELAGQHCRYAQASQSPPALVLTKEEVARIRALAAAEQWCAEYPLQPWQYGLNGHEELVQHVYNGQLAASRERGKLDEPQRDEFVFKWLAQHSPRHPDPQDLFPS